MRIIAHRGNTNGCWPSKENSPDYIDYALNRNFDAEIDLWCNNGILYLGHDTPTYKIDINWIYNRIEKLWIHCKNAEALEFLSTCRESLCIPNYFWHNTDEYTITSLGFLWAYPKIKNIGTRCVSVMPDLKEWDSLILNENVYGVCTDNAGLLQQVIKIRNA